MFFKDILNRPPDFGEILDKAIEVGASDILLRRGLPIMYKVGGVWYRFSEEDLPDMAPYLAAIARIVGDEEAGLERFAKEQDVDLSFSLPNGYRFRANHSSMKFSGFTAVYVEGKDEETVMEDVFDAGAEDFDMGDGVAEVTTTPAAFSDVRAALEDKGYEFISADVAMVPSTYTALSDPDDLKKMGILLDHLEDDDDVQNVWHNLENEEDLDR